MKEFDLGMKLNGERGRGATKPEAQSRVISVPQACQLLGISRSTLYKLIQIGEIPAFKLSQGGRWRFEQRDLEEWLEDRKSAEAPPIKELG